MKRLPVLMLAALTAVCGFGQTRYQDRGMWDLDLNSTVTIPHSSPSDAVGTLTLSGGYFVTRGLLLEGGVVGIFNANAKNVLLAGGARYFFRSATSSVRPFLGGAEGVNVLAVSGASNSNSLSLGTAGLRFYVARHVAIEFAYEFEYVHVAGLSLKDASDSVITLGFAHVF